MEDGWENEPVLVLHSEIKIRLSLNAHRLDVVVRLSYLNNTIQSKVVQTNTSIRLCFNVILLIPKLQWKLLWVVK